MWAAVEGADTKAAKIRSARIAIAELKDTCAGVRPQARPWWVSGVVAEKLDTTASVVVPVPYWAPTGVGRQARN